ncbi:MAG: GDSL-type esterase/lipase family protein [Candidatus Thiodiazotropha taylori]
MQNSTQNSEDNELIISDTLKEPEAELPAGPEVQQPEQVAFTHLQDSVVIRKITVLMDMISTMRCEMSKLTKEVNYLAQQLVADQSIYRTVDQTNASSPSLNQSVDNEVLQRDGAQEEVLVHTKTRPQVTSDSNLPSPALELPDLQTKQYSDVLRTSTPRDTSNGTPHRPCPVPKRTLQPQVPRPSPRAASRAIHNNDSNQILSNGDYLISSVNPKGLTSTVVKNGISGGNIDKVSTQIKLYDLRKFSHVIVYVGGNDASNGTDIEYFEEVFDQVIQHIKAANNQCKIILCASCPRSDTSTSDVNDIMHTLAQHHNISFIDQNKAFHDRRGNIIAGYYDTDGIHLSPSGVKRLLGTINKEVTIVDDFAKCAYGRRQGIIRRQQPRKQQQQQYHQTQQSQGRRNRSTQETDRLMIITGNVSLLTYAISVVKAIMIPLIVSIRIS